MLYFVYSLFFLLSMHSINGDRSASVITTLEKTDSDRWTRIVAINDVRDPMKQTCIGTIVSESYILIGFQCIKNYRAENDDSQMTKVNIVFLNENRSVIRYVDHISISSSTIALLHLSNSLNLSSSASPMIPKSLSSNRLWQTKTKSSLLIVGVHHDVKDNDLKMANVFANIMDHQDSICQQQIRRLNNEECYIISRTDVCAGMFSIYHNFHF